MSVTADQSLEVNPFRPVLLDEQESEPARWNEQFGRPIRGMRAYLLAASFAERADRWPWPFTKLATQKRPVRFEIRVHDFQHDHSASPMTYAFVSLMNRGRSNDPGLPVISSERSALEKGGVLSQHFRERKNAAARSKHDLPCWRGVGENGERRIEPRETGGRARAVAFREGCERRVELGAELRAQARGCEAARSRCRRSAPPGVAPVAPGSPSPASPRAARSHGSPNRLVCAPSPGDVDRAM